MAKKLHAKRYSQAIFEIALEKKEIERWQADLQKIAGAVSDPAFAALLENPKVSFGDKDSILSKVLAGVNPMALNLLRLLITRSSLRIAGEIAEGYQSLVDNYRGIAPARVTTAITLDEADKRKLADSLAAIVGKKVVIKSETDPAVVGGVIVRIGGKLLDGSTRSRLLALKEELAGAAGRSV